MQDYELTHLSIHLIGNEGENDYYAVIKCTECEEVWKLEIDHLESRIATAMFKAIYHSIQHDYSRSDKGWVSRG